MIQLTTGLALFFTSIYGTTGVQATELAQTASTTPVAQIIVMEATTTPVTMEAYLKEYFVENPLLAEIAKCESTYRHFDSNGKVMRGVVDSADVGVMQINERYHLEQAAKLGLDIRTLEGNLAYAEHLFKKSGATPWNASKPCWGKTQAYKDYLVQLAVK